MRSRDAWAARAAFAVVALYGLLLSTFLGAMVPTSLSSAAAVRCQATGDDPAAPHAPAHRAECCMPGCVAAPAAPPAASMAILPVPPSRLLAQARMQATSLPRRPTGPTPLPRGPPAA